MSIVFFSDHCSNRIKGYYQYKIKKENLSGICWAHFSYDFSQKAILFANLGNLLVVSEKYSWQKGILCFNTPFLINS